MSKAATKAEKTGIVAPRVKISARASLPMNEDVIHSDFVPSDIVFEEHNALLEGVSIAMENQMPVLLIGETGTGKTALVRHLAAITKNGFMRVNHNGGTTIEDILGRYLIDSNGTKWCDGALVKAMKEGLWYLADEINAASAEINFVYHALLDDDAKITLVEKDNEVIRPHANFRFFGAMNPPGDYAGTKELNRALLSRFAVVKVDYASPEIEVGILVDRTGISKTDAELMVETAGKIRVAHAQEKFRYVLSTRDLLMWAKLKMIYGKFIPAAEMSVLNKVDTDDFEAIKDILTMKFKSIDTGASAKTASIPTEVEFV